MKNFSQMCAQGDVVILRIAAIPESAKVVEPEADGRVIVTHSETGHHHAFLRGGAMIFEASPPDPLLCYLRIESPAALEHLRAWDTHESILFPPGDYEIRRQREHTPEGWRRVED